MLQLELKNNWNRCLSHLRTRLGEQLMIDVVDTRIKAFGKTPKANFVSPSELLITLTIGQLQELVTQAVEKAIQPLQDEVESFRAIITSQD